MVMLEERPGTPQQTVYVLKSAPSATPPHYLVVHVWAKEQIDAQDEPVATDSEEAVIDADTIRALELAWSPMVRAARWPDAHAASQAALSEVARWGRSSTYTFDYDGDDGYGQGMTVAPRPGSCTASLVSLGRALVRYVHAQSAADRHAIGNEIQRASRKLAERAQRQAAP